MADDTFTPAEIRAMDVYEIGKHLSGGYGPGKTLKMFRSIQAIAKLALDLPKDKGQHS